MSDQYWFKPSGTDLNWRDINYFENGYEEALGEALLSGQVAGLGKRPVHSPDTATPGMLSKAWMRKDGVDYLNKGGVGNENREPYNELLATRLLSRLLGKGEFVPYGLVDLKGRMYSSCPTMIAPDTELVPAADVLTAFGVIEGRDPYGGYLAAAQELGVQGIGEDLDKMIVADFLMANFDRHAYNFGLIRNAETLDGYRVAPLFDSGCGFYSRATTKELVAGRYLWESHPFRRYPSQQLALVESFAWYDPSCLEGFLDDVAEVLSLNPHLDEVFIEAVQLQTAKQLEKVNDAAAERGMVFPGW